jgi:hypothetical protein
MRTLVLPAASLSVMVALTRTDLSFLSNRRLVALSLTLTVTVLPSAPKKLRVASVITFRGEILSFLAVRSVSLPLTRSFTLPSFSASTPFLEALTLCGTPARDRNGRVESLCGAGGFGWGKLKVGWLGSAGGPDAHTTAGRATLSSAPGPPPGVSAFK